MRFLLNLEQSLCYSEISTLQRVIVMGLGIVTNMARHVIEAVIPDGLHKGKVLFIPRIFNTPPKNFTPHMTRIQFPIKLAFAITSNKSQGQSLESIGIYLNAGREIMLLV